MLDSGWSGLTGAAFVTGASGLVDDGAAADRMELLSRMKRTWASRYRFR